MTQLKTAFICSALLAGFVGLLGLAAQEYKCLPYEPKTECDLSRYEVRLHDITERSRKLIGIAETSCVYTIGEGKSKRIVVTDAEFTAANRTDYFEKAEFPFAQSLVCRVE